MGQKPEEAAVTLAGAVLAHDIEQTPEATVAKIIDGFRPMIGSPRYVDELRANVSRHIAANTFPANVEPLLWRLQWAILRVDDLYCHHRVSENIKNLFNSEISGALHRESFDQRQRNRSAEFLGKIVGG